MWATRVIERCEQLSSAFEAGDAFGISGDRLRQDLYRHIPIEVPVVSAVHLAHSPGAEHRADFVGAEARAFRQAHKALRRSL